MFYHYTSLRHLPGIAEHGLTVGDVPTDIRRDRGRIGVWLTTSDSGKGHGLERSKSDKRTYRLSVAIELNSPQLHRWMDWAPKNATPETIAALNETGRAFQTWWVYFGVIPRDAIVACTLTTTSELVQQWWRLCPAELAYRPVPAWRREAWHKRLLKDVRRARSKQAVYVSDPLGR